MLKTDYSKVAKLYDQNKEELTFQKTSTSKNF